MKKIKVELNSHSYPIFIGKSILPGLNSTITGLNLNKKIAVIIDANVAKFHKQSIVDAFRKYKNNLIFYTLKPGEKSKSYKELNNIYSFLLDNGFGRDALVFVFGGGVAGDLGAFAASTYMRGVQLVHVPTTLLATVDSSIGGKTGINFSDKKNMIGTFYQPEAVLIDTDFLYTLSRPEITSGIGEIIKYAFLSDKKFFGYVSENINEIYKFNEKVLEQVIIKSAIIKAGVVSFDEREGGLRKILNLGHTFAHAFESDLRFKVKHGEAVIAGIIAALCLSQKLRFLKPAVFDNFIQLPKKVKLSKLISDFDPENVLELMRSDKKNRDGKIKFVLLSDIGKILIDVEAGKKDVLYSLNKAKELLS